MDICSKCGSKTAQWIYGPDGCMMCDDCVPRGCSCNVDDETGKECTDDKDRLYPCCEWWEL